MTVIRTHHNRENPYVMLNKSIVQSKTLSLKAKGLWALLMSYPNDWKFYVKVLIEECQEGRTAIYNTIDELIAARLMVKIKTFEKKPDGKMCGGGVEYIIFEFPISEDQFEAYQNSKENIIKPSHNEYDRDSGFGNSGNGNSGNQQLLSTDSLPSIEGNDNVAMPHISEGLGELPIARKPPPQFNEKHREKFNILKSANLDAEDHSLEFLATTYCNKKILDALHHLQCEIDKGTKIKKSKIAFLRYILSGKVSMITEQSNTNKQWAENAKKGMPWPSLKIHEKYAECEYCMKEIPFDLSNKEFGDAMNSLWQLSQRYQQ